MNQTAGNAPGAAALTARQDWKDPRSVGAPPDPAGEGPSVSGGVKPLTYPIEGEATDRSSNPFGEASPARTRHRWLR